ncbi:MAG: cupin [Rhodospirillaceae bacterium]|nr:cupin [Rhodospirillaceae bacterium]|tara:strand:- start:43 stop:561 length:519 start_codon:yes stop_codon:yes gene_type:complete
MGEVSKISNAENYDTTHPFATGELVLDSIPEDERLWVPMTEGVWFRPLMFNIVQGGWCHLIKVKKAGIVSRHRHPSPVHGLVIKGEWRYLEHDWIARKGTYIFEPPSETHTLVVDDHTPEMITFFHVTGSLHYVDNDGNATGFDDVFTRIDLARDHYENVGLGSDYVKNFVR